MQTVYDLNPSDFKNEKEYIAAIRTKQLEEQKIVGQHSWIEYIKNNKPEAYSKMKRTSKSFGFDIDTAKSFSHYAQELKRLDIAS